MWTLKKILVPTDFSPGAHAAIETAIAMARLSKASLTLFHAYELPAILMASTAYITDETVAALEDNAASALRDELAAIEKQLGPGGGVALSSQLRMGPPALTIIDEATTGGYDLIIMGTHGRTGLKHFLIGSVAERVVRLARCPVMTVH